MATGLDALHRSYPDVEVINVWNKADPGGDAFPQVLGGYKYYRIWRGAYALPIWRDPAGVQQDIYLGGMVDKLWTAHKGPYRTLPSRSCCLGGEHGDMGGTPMRVRGSRSERVTSNPGSLIYGALAFAVNGGSLILFATLNRATRWEGAPPGGYWLIPIGTAVGLGAITRFHRWRAGLAVVSLEYCGLLTGFFALSALATGVASETAGFIFLGLLIGFPLGMGVLLVLFRLGVFLRDVLRQRDRRRTFSGPRPP